MRLSRNSILLQACLFSVMSEYTKCIADSLKLFFLRFDAHLKECELLDIQSHKNETNVKDRTSSEVITLVLNIDWTNMK